MTSCKNIKDFTPISALGGLEILNIEYRNILDISFLGKNKNIKELELFLRQKIKDFTPISKLARLEILNIGDTNISDISFL